MHNQVSFIQSRADHRKLLIRCQGLLLLILALAPAAGQARAQAHKTPPSPPKDTLTLSDGEQLIGKLVKVNAGALTFHSDILGDVTVPLAKVKALHAGEFAVIEKDQHVTPKTARQQVPVGAIAVENETVHVSPSGGERKDLPAKKVNTLIDAASFNKELDDDRSFFHGWTGPVTVGASLVESTNSTQTYTGSVALVRAVPTGGWLPPGSKTILNLRGTYGLARDALIVSDGTVLQPASVTKTDILHGGAEYDKYVSSKFFALVNASADHNFGSGLQLQQAYGGGFGWSMLNNPKSSLDLKGAMQFEQQQFYNGSSSRFGTPTDNLASAALTETFKRNLAHSIKFSQYITLTPTFNIAQAYSAVVNANLLFPAYKKINFTLSSTDNYLGDPPAGYERNAFQFTAGISYVVK